MKLNRKVIPVFLIALLGALGTWHVLTRSEKPTSTDSAKPADYRNLETPIELTVDSTVAQQAKIGVEECQSQLEQVLEALRKSGGAEESKRILAELNRFLAGVPKEVAIAAISQFVDAGDDASTSLEFRVDRGGLLETPPTLRVALLDWLGKHVPKAAAEMAEKILAQPTHADEWAVSFRNYARVHPSDSPQHREFLRSKFEEMLDIDDWREEPTVGFLESFDVLVHVGAVESAPKLAELVASTAQEDRATAHASFLTLDRLTLARPTEMLGELTKHPEMIRARGGMVSNFYARADVRDPDQRRLVEDYLLNPARTEAELKAFAGTYPNANQMISNNLLTPVNTQNRESIVAHDAAALVVVNQWVADPRFEKIRPHTRTMQRRLLTFVKQAAKKPTIETQ